MIVLGIETSCDETAAAIVRDGHDVISNVVFSQVDLHGPYGGVVPEIASRCHVEILPGVIRQALDDAAMEWDDIDAVAATYGPGLASSLMIGFSAGKGLAMRLGCELVAVNHIEAHLYSVFIGDAAPRPEDVGPILALVVSGGHTALIRCNRIGDYSICGETIDDAAGEAFDKAAQLLDLGYPGGPVIDRITRGQPTDAVKFPQGRPKPGNPALMGMDASLCWSFSGLKTSLMYYLRENPLQGDEDVVRIAASYQEAIVQALVKRCDRALDAGGMDALAAGGGVSLNSRLREELGRLAERRGVPLLLAEPRFCGDNAAMIAGLAGAGQGVRGEAAFALDVMPNLELGR